MFVRWVKLLICAFGTTTPYTIIVLGITIPVAAGRTEVNGKAVPGTPPNNVVFTFFWPFGVFIGPFLIIFFIIPIINPFGNIASKIKQSIRSFALVVTAHLREYRPSVYKTTIAEVTPLVIGGARCPRDTFCFQCLLLYVPIQLQWASAYCSTHNIFCNASIEARI